MSVAGIRSLIKTSLDGISGLHTSETVPSVIIPPMAFPALRPSDALSYDFTAQNASLVYHFYVEVLVNKGATLEQAQDDLDPYLQNSGSTSIKAAVEAINWSTTADMCRVNNVSNYGPATYGGVEYLGARLAVDVWGTNSPVATPSTSPPPVWVDTISSQTLSNKYLDPSCYPLRYATTGITAATTDQTIVCTATTAFTVTLPVTTSSDVGKIYYIKNINTGTITVDVAPTHEAWAYL